MADYRVLVTGSRDWNRPGDIVDALCALPILMGYRPPVLVHGAAAGADTIAGWAATRLGWRVEVHPAVWRPNGVYNPQAGLLRNREMVDLGADICLAFIRLGSRGASHCARLAEEAGIDTRYYRDDSPRLPRVPSAERRGL